VRIFSVASPAGNSSGKGVSVIEYDRPA